MLEIVGKPSDVDRYKKARGVAAGIDPSTGQRVKYSGLKKFGPDAAQRLGQNNPWLKYGPDFRLGIAHLQVVKKGKKEADGDSGRLNIIGIANANIVDRYDERLAPEGVITDDFNKNPVLLVDHAYATRAVVGRVTNITPEHDGVKFEAFVGDTDAVGGIQNLTPTQRETRSLVAQGLVQTVSVGFIPKKIQAPVYNDNGEMEEPAVILQWQLLELSIVAIPANPGSTFEMRQYALALNETTEDTAVSGKTQLTMSRSSGNNVEQKIAKLKSDKATAVQTLIFDKEFFDKESAVEWAVEHGYKADKVDETEDSLRIRQREPDDFDQDTLRTIELTDGVQAVVGRLLEEEDEMTEEQAKQLIDGMNTLSQSVQDGFKALSDQNEKILGSVAGKGDKPDDEMDDDEDEDMKKTVKSQGEAIEALRKQMDEMDTVVGKIYEKVCA